jgi:L-ascorbate metabolism protein UlaG (beta-lactamase superfamily)
MDLPERVDGYDTLMEMIRRRTFLQGAAIGVGGAGLTASYLAFSSSRTARWFRRLAGDYRRSIPAAPVKPNPAQWSDNQITFAWLGHSSVLINFYGLRILTDPVLGSRCGISTGFGTLGPKRLVAPALSVKELPPIDVVVLSHAHYDHFDTPTLSQLGRETWIATAQGTADVIEGQFSSVNELAWGEEANFRGPKGELKVQAIEVKHWGERWPSKKRRGYNGYALHREGKSILFGGDTAQTGALASASAHGPYVAGIMPIGAYQPWIWNHCTPEQALDMTNAARARYILPVHHQTFKLSDEPRLEPIQRLTSALQKEPERLAWRDVGDTFVCPA